LSDPSQDLAATALEIVAAWGWRDPTLAPLAGGLINATYAVHVQGQPVAVLQRLHHVFGADVNFDIDAVTTRLAAQGLATPRLLRTTHDALWVEHEGRIWRALSWQPGQAVASVASAEWAARGGELVARYHSALAGFAYDYRFVRAGVHDTAAHLTKLQQRLARAVATAAGPGQDDVLEHARDVGQRIMAMAASTMAFDLAAMPQRHIHGDLKISNLLFATAPLRGHCLVDLDTVGRGTLAFELGDAMRSWCNPHGEDTGRVAFDLSIFQAAMDAYFAAAAPSLGISVVERQSVVHGLLRVCVELAARFCVDIFDDSYFGWDATRFASRRAHNLVRAQGQLALAQSVAANFDAALAIVS
jgi:Ser/Thr protein kinase RdoA (MazF antagonist)